MLAKEAKRLELLKERQRREIEQIVAYEIEMAKMQDQARARQERQEAKLAALKKQREASRVAALKKKYAMEQQRAREEEEEERKRRAQAAADFEFQKKIEMQRRKKERQLQIEARRRADERLRKQEAFLKEIEEKR